MAMTKKRHAPKMFKQIHKFESTEFYQCNIVLLINREQKKHFARGEKTLEEINGMVRFHLTRRLLKAFYSWKQEKGWTMSNLTINITRHFKPTLLSQKVLSLITLKSSVKSLPPLIFHW